MVRLGTPPRRGAGPRRPAGGPRPRRGPAAPRGKGRPRFEADVLPIFRAKCLRCHGDRAHRADLDLTTAAGVLKGGETGPAVVPGSPEKSLLYEKVDAGDMPPGKKDRLSKDEVATIRRWIEGGALDRKSTRLK